MASPNVKFYDIRSYGDWNRIQDRIEHGKEWAITYICKLRLSSGSVSLYVNSSCTQEHALTQQIKFCSSIHLSLDAFQLIDLALRLSVAILRR